MIHLISALVVQHAVAISLEFRVCNLISELLTDALVFFGFFEPAWAVPALPFKSLFNVCYKFFILIESYCHFFLSFYLFLICPCKDSRTLNALVHKPSQEPAGNDFSCTDGGHKVPVASLKTVDVLQYQRHYK